VFRFLFHFDNVVHCLMGDIKIVPLGDLII